MREPFIRAKRDAAVVLRHAAVLRALRHICAQHRVRAHARLIYSLICRYATPDAHIYAARHALFYECCHAIDILALMFMLLLIFVFTLLCRERRARYAR